MFKRLVTTKSEEINKSSPGIMFWQFTLKMDQEKYEQLQLYLRTNSLLQGLCPEQRSKIQSKSHFFE